jgi:hypothetical protein
MGEDGPLPLGRADFEYRLAPGEVVRYRAAEDGQGRPRHMSGGRPRKKREARVD